MYIKNSENVCVNAVTVKFFPTVSKQHTVLTSDHTTKPYISVPSSFSQIACALWTLSTQHCQWPTRTLSTQHYQWPTRTLSTQHYLHTALPVTHQDSLHTAQSVTQQDRPREGNTYPFHFRGPFICGQKSEDAIRRQLSTRAVSDQTPGSFSHASHTFLAFPQAAPCSAWRHRKVTSSDPIS